MSATRIEDGTMNIIKSLLSGFDDKGLRGEIVNVLKRVRDPEIPVNIYDLGLIYELDVDRYGQVDIRMTLTTPNCPMAQTFPAQVADAVKQVPGVVKVDIELVWVPPWDLSRVSEVAKLELNMY